MVICWSGCDARIRGWEVLAKLVDSSVWVGYIVREWLIGVCGCECGCESGERSDW